MTEMGKVYTIIGRSNIYVAVFSLEVPLYNLSSGVGVGDDTDEVVKSFRTPILLSHFNACIKINSQNDIMIVISELLTFPYV